MRLGDLYEPTFPKEAIPNPFVVSEHWKPAIEAMVELARKGAEEKGGPEYEPDVRAEGAPSSAGDGMLPDLHLGLGGARGTHTNRQVLENRLLSALLNKLSTVDMLDEIRDEDGNFPAREFVVKMDKDGEAMNRPCQLVEALIASGHDVKACTAIRTTTFGLALSVKDDEEWTGIPLAVVLRTGLQTEKGENIPFCLTHSSVEFYFDGPLLKGLLIQFFHDATGTAIFCSGHYPDAPWSVDAKTHPLPDPVSAVRTAGLLGCVINSTASARSLFLGGYGTLGVCNDSAATVELALTGKTHVYPLMAEAMAEMPNDVHPIPSTMEDTARRMLSSLPEVPVFKNMEDTRRMLKEEFGI
eukprot:CAMPEP_0183296648 /NCGR_PEP_ID=MMETSP0160_2-20130417/4107_1 /TAXON_ID=2839 ORGANISM="Odontella Sinensis, Strain Grunow 1884" /NCGR_SAMPLE_ID=MMETSP0160_2 /ASSEMBLY_ACC=CAM_ASM_000250 /LENGTH=355 /DNA_ID=CAMNT_0025458281 /DNA_START=60 /DNA_END=1127 /DNA_ORIENTATION=+